MNNKVRVFIKNVIYAVGANTCQIFTTLILTLILPKILSVESYSYWQLYQFYGTYLLYSSFGWGEGLFIKYGGISYRDLNKKVLSSQVIGIFIHEVLCGFIILMAVMTWMKNEPRKELLLMGATVYMILRVVRFQLQTILQASSRITDYAKLYSGERILFLCISLGCILVKKIEFYVFIWAELLSNLVTLIYGIYLCKEVVFTKPCSFRDELREEKELIQSGFSISLASLLGQMTIGIVRFAVEQKYGTIAFGKISLSFSMANMMVTCITAVSIVIFPVLKRLKQEKADRLYMPLREIMTIPMFGILLLYVPMSQILSMWLPQYKDSIKYLAVLLPLFIYEVRNSVLANTYLKVREEQKYIMYANICIVAVSAGVTYLTVYTIGSINLAVVSIIGLYALKAILTEHMLKKFICIKTGILSLQELMLTGAFILLSWNCRPWIAFLGYLLCYCIYFLGGKNRFIDAYQIMKGVIKS